MRKILSVILMCMASIPTLCQSSASKYQPGTIMAVKPHQGATGEGSSVVRYDISVRVGDTVYVVLFTPPPGTYGVQYSAGRELLVLVESKTITFNDMLGNSRKVPILSRKAVRAQSKQ